MKKIPYSDKLDADQQISTEEKIAAYLQQSDITRTERWMVGVPIAATPHFRRIRCLFGGD